jgi:cytochrome c556
MRGFLEAVQSITKGIANEDMTMVATNASAVGVALTRNASPALMAKLPLDFKKLGFATHSAFDDLAQEATDMGNAKVISAKLGELLGRCTSCHAGYRFYIESN